MNSTTNQAGVNADLSGVLETIADLVAAKVVRLLRDGDVGMVDQHGSPLGNRRHISAVRRRLASGEGGAAKVGRRYLLSTEALSNELTAKSKSKPKTAKPGTAMSEKLERELRLVGGERR